MATATIVSDLTKLQNKARKLAKELEATRAEIEFARSSLRAMVSVNNKYKTFTELHHQGRVLRVKYNSYGDCKVTENGKEIDTSLPVSGRIRPTINDLRLLVAMGVI